MFRRSAIALPLSGLALFSLLPACGGGHSTTVVPVQDTLQTATPIKHVVVIYGENVSFDHFFVTYPKSTNPAGEPSFTTALDTPAVNGQSVRHTAERQQQLQQHDEWCRRRTAVLA